MPTAAHLATAQHAMSLRCGVSAASAGVGRCVRVHPENRNRSAATGADVPYLVTTRTSTVPEACAGLVTSRPLDERTFSVPPGDVPNRTARTPTRLRPATVTRVPPELGPDDTDRPVTTGGATYRNRSTRCGVERRPPPITVTCTRPGACLGAV